MAWYNAPPGNDTFLNTTPTASPPNYAQGAGGGYAPTQYGVPGTSSYHSPEGDPRNTWPAGTPNGMPISTSDPYVQYGMQGLYDQMMAPVQFWQQQVAAAAQAGRGLDQQKGLLDAEKLKLQFGVDKGSNALDQQGVGVKRNRLGLEQGFIDRAFGLANRSADREYEDASNAMYTRQMEKGAGLTVGGAMDARDSLLDQLDIAKKTAGLGKDRSEADLARDKGLLDVEGAKLGLEKGGLEAMLNNALKQVGLADAVSALDLSTLMSSTNVESVKIGAEMLGILNQILANNPEFVKNTGQQLAPGAPGSPILGPPAPPGTPVSFGTRQ